MNQSSSNSSLPCSFTSPKDFLLFANNRSTIITQTITDCPQVCNIFYGTGNPDIVGVGVCRLHRPLFGALAHHLTFHQVTLAFALQLAFVGLTGILLMTIRWIAFAKWTDLPRSQPLRRLHKSTVELFDSLTLVNIFVSIAIAAASLSLVRNGPPPIFEDEILRLINGIQFWLLALYYLIGFCLTPFRPRSRLRFCVLATCGGFTCFNMYLAYFLTRRVSTPDVLPYKLAVKTCQEVFHYPSLWVNYDLTQQEKDDSHKQDNSPLNYLYVFASLVGSVLALGLLLGLCILSYILMEWLEEHCKPLHRLISGIGRFIITSPSKAYKSFQEHRLLRAFLVITVFSGHYIAGTSYAVFRLYQYRSRIEKFNQQEFQGNQRTFGQITAIVAYLPIGYDILFSIAGR